MGKLTACDVCLQKIENLDTLTSLEQLWLGKNKITSLDGLSSLTNLTILSIQSNHLTSLEGLCTLTALEELYISHNNIAQLSGLEHNTSLRVIDMSANPIAKLEGLETLEHLEELWASYCKLDSFKDVEAQLRDKRELKTVYFEGTPLQLRQPALYRNKVRLAVPQVVQIDASKSINSLFCSPCWLLCVCVCVLELCGCGEWWGILRVC